MEDDARRLNLTHAERVQPVPAMAAVPQGLGDHPVIQVPFTVEIDGRNYRGHGLSLVLAEIGGLVDPALAGQDRLIHLLFAFDGFHIALSLEGVVHAFDRDAGRATVVFRDPMGPHLPQLRHILNSYIAGDLVTLGQTLGVAAASPKAQGAKSASPAAKGSFLHRVWGTAVMGGLTVALVAAVSGIVFGRIYATPVAAPAQVRIDGTTLDSVAAGQIDYINPAAQMGEVAFSLRATSGQMMSITMPCDCVATSAGPGVGATVLPGAPVLQLAAADAGLILTGTVPREQVFALASADHVVVRFADGARVTAQVDAASLGQGISATADEVAFRLIPVTPLDAARQGQLAELKIMAPAPALLQPVLGLMDRINVF
jgi:mannuronan synthase